VPHDATGYGNNALTAGKRDDGGMIGYGLRLDGTTPIRIAASPSLAIPAGQAMTWSMWVHPNDGVRSGVLVALRNGANALTIGLDNGVAYAQLETSAGTLRTSPGTPLTEGFHHIAVTASDHVRVYVDGELRGDVAATLPAMSAAAVLGTALPAPAAPAAPDTPATPAGGDTTVPAAPAQPAPPPLGFAGVIDELEISKVVRPTGAFQVAVRDQGPQANLLVFDQPEQSSLLGNSYVGIIVRSVTPDAWVVIGILGVMALLSWVVMVAKALYVRRISHANRVFRAEFRAAMARVSETGGHFGALEMQRPHILRHSPLFRLYQLGAREVNERLEQGRVDADGRLAMQSLAAVRAALDAGLAHENQRLSRLMVLLTIAISGGPFLGLLGTVIGVMITFAAIAAAGDVNINAIAPGISAALLATVAGLAVAIPALFGYNYFIIRIRDANVDMQVFVDEMVTRIGEGVTAVAATPIGRRAAAE
jgi:biopolymer transport protein ExbB